jgi:hypothetical protein
MKRSYYVLILLLQFFFVSNAFNAVVSVDLIYDKSAVYAGNKVEFSLKVTTHNGKEFFSNSPKSKFYFSDFNLKLSPSVVMDRQSDSYLRVLIPENQTASDFYIQLSEKSNPEKIYTITIPIIDHRKNVTAIFLKELPKKVQNGTELPLALVAQMNDGTIEEVKEKNKIKPSDFVISIQQGGKFDPYKSSVFIVDSNKCNPVLSIDVKFIANPKLSIQQTIEIIPLETLNEYYFGTSGTDKRDGADGQNGDSGGMFAIHGQAGTNGEHGQKGENGSNAPSMAVKLSCVQKPCSSDTLIRVEIINSGVPEIFYLATNFTKFRISSVGGSGGDGGDGGEGGNGGNGKFYLLNEQGDTGNGGDGGFGGDGGDGGNGGNGDNIYVYYTNDLVPYLQRIEIKSSGGKGGDGGDGGDEGRAGDPGNGTTVGTPGRPGTPGRAGRNGQSGSDGTVTFVKI